MGSLHQSIDVALQPTRKVEQPAANPGIARAHSLQRTLGNQAVLRMSAVNDPIEREADATAHAVMQTRDPGHHVSNRDAVAGAVGKPLDPVTRSFFEPRFGADFSAVRIHQDRSAADAATSIDARAFTIGNDIFFGSDQYAPHTDAGRGVLAHELAHVQQQAPDMILRAPAAGPAQLFTGPDDAPPVVVGGEAEGERFLFTVNTANFRRGEEKRLRAFAKVMPKDALLNIHGFASEEGEADHNEQLSIDRAAEAKRVLLDSGIAPTQIEGFYAHGATRGGHAAHRAVVIDVRMKPGPRVLDPDTKSALAHLHRLAARAASEPGGSGVQAAVEAFTIQLQADLEAVPDGQPLPDDLLIVVKALLLWDIDKGDQWGEGRLDSKDFTPSAAAYAVVPAAQNKCNAFLAEVIYRATRVVHQGHQVDGVSPTAPRAWFPFRAKEWGDVGFTIPNFPVVTSPVRGDIMCTGTHVGIYLGTYAGLAIYISARDNANGVFGIGEQFEHGIQIKETSAAIYRRYQP